MRSVSILRDPIGLSEDQSLDEKTSQRQSLTIRKVINPDTQQPTIYINQDEGHQPTPVNVVASTHRLLKQQHQSLSKMTDTERQLLNLQFRVDFKDELQEMLEQIPKIQMAQTGSLKRMQLTGTSAELAIKETIRHRILAAFELRWILENAYRNAELLALDRINFCEEGLKIADIDNPLAELPSFAKLKNLLNFIPPIAITGSILLNDFTDAFLIFETKVATVSVSDEVVAIFPHLAAAEYAVKKAELVEHVKKYQRLVIQYYQNYLDLDQNIMKFCAQQNVMREQFLIWQKEIFEAYYQQVKTHPDYLYMQKVRFEIDIEQGLIERAFKLGSVNVSDFGVYEQDINHYLHNALNKPYQPPILHSIPKEEKKATQKPSVKGPVMAKSPTIADITKALYGDKKDEENDENQDDEGIDLLQFNWSLDKPLTKS